MTNGIASNIPESIKKDYENNKEILLSAKKDKAIIFLIRINTNSFIETISGRNQNGFIFIKKMKEKTNFFKELKTFYVNKKIYLIFDNVKEDLRFMDSLLDEKQLSIYHGFPPVINGLYRRYKDENGEQKILSLFTKLEKSSIKNNKLEKTKPMNKVTKNSEEIIEDDEWPWFNEQEEE